MGNFRKNYIFLSQMINLTGTYECKIDDKGRLKVPSALMKQLSHLAGESFVIKSSIHRPCVEVYPQQGWDKLMAKLDNLDVTFNPKHGDFLRIFLKGVKVIEIDGSDRLQISKDLVQYAHLSKEVVVTCMSGLFEVWDKTEYDEKVRISEEDFAKMTEEIMANKNNS